MKFRLPSYKYIFGVGILLVFFTIYYSFVAYTTLHGLPFTGYPIFNWPDEMSNHFFIKQFIETNTFVQAEPLNDLVQNVIHPRSVNILKGSLVPTGFLGILLVFGFLGKLISLYGTTILTPLFAVVGVVAFRGIVRQIFSDKVANLSAILLFTLSTYWYYSSLVMLPTVLFISLLLIGVYFTLQQSQQTLPRKKLVCSLLGGVFIGLSLITRPTEFFWVGIIFISILVFLRKKIHWYQLTGIFLALVLPVLLMLSFNYIIYGNAFSVGYLRFQQAPNSVAQLPSEFEITTQSATLAYIKAALLPFGFHPKLIVFNFYKYFLKFLWPYVALFVAGMLLFLRNYRQGRLEQKEKIFLLISFVVSLCLFSYYGSWLLADKMVLIQNTISNSYVRYWLPINILILPVIAYFITQLGEFKISRKIILLLQICLVTGLIVFSINQVYRTPGDGFFDQQKTIAQYYRQAVAVQTIVPKDSIIIVDRADKLFFPKYRVVVFNGDNTIFSKLKNIQGQVPIYYFTNLTDDAINRLNVTDLSALNLIFEHPLKIDENFRLFRLK